MRICLVTSALPEVDCGIGDYTDRLARALVAANAEPVVVTTGDPQLVEGTPYLVERLGTSWTARETLGIARRIDALRPDVVHVQFPGATYGRGFGVTFLPWALRGSRPRRGLVITLHEFSRLRTRHKLRIASACVPCDAVVTPGESTTGGPRNWLRWRLGLAFAAIPLASNISPLRDTTDRPANFRRAPGELVVGYWGFLREDKGVLDLLDAFSLVRTQRPARLVIAGAPGPDHEYRRRVTDRINVLGIGQDVVVTGRLSSDDLSRALAAFDICVLPFSEGLTENRGTYAAAVAHGTPIVTTHATRRGHDDATLTDFVPPGDAQAIAAAVRGAVPARARRPEVVEGSSWPDIAQRHLELYRRVVRR